MAIEKGGVQKDVLYVYYTDSIWTRYLSKPEKDNNQYKLSVGNRTMAGLNNHREKVHSYEDIAAVYYLVGDYRTLAQMIPEEFAKAASEAVLLWEK